MRKPPTSRKRLKGGKKSAKAVFELQRQTEIRQAFEAAAAKFFESAPDGAFVREVELLLRLLHGGSLDIPLEARKEWPEISEEQWNQISRKTRTDLLWRVLLDPFLALDKQHYIRLTEAFEKLKKYDEDMPWEALIFEAFEFLLEQFDKSGASFPRDRDPVKKLAKHLRALYIAFPGNRDNKVRDYLPVKITEIPPVDRELVKRAMRTVHEPKWHLLFPRCGLSLLRANKGGRPLGSKNVLH